MNAPQDKHPEGVGERVGEQPHDSGPPVVKYILSQTLVDVVAEEATDYREPDHEEVNYVVEGSQDPVPGVEAEAPLHLGEEQEAEVLQVPVEQHRREEDQGAEGAQEEGYFVLPRLPEAPAEEGEADQHEEQVEGEELPTGRQEGVAPALHAPEFGEGVVGLDVKGLEDLVPAGPHLVEEDVGGHPADQLPLLVLELLQFLEESLHPGPIGPLVEHVELQFVDVDQEAEKRQHLSTSWNFVDSPNKDILDKSIDCFLEKLIMIWGLNRVDTKSASINFLSSGTADAEDVVEASFTV